MINALEKNRVFFATRRRQSPVFPAMPPKRLSDLLCARSHQRCAHFFGQRPASSLLLAVSLFSFAAGCATARPILPAIALAHVNGEPVTVELMETAFTESHQGHSAFLAGPGVVREVLEKVIDKQLLLQEARRIGLDRDAVIEQAVDRLRGTRASEQFFRDKITSRVKISEEAILAAHERIGHRFQARHILVATREEAQKAHDRIRGGADFGEVALEVSQAGTAAKGGYMGIIAFGALDQELEDRLWSLALGELSEPFRTREGWNLLYVTEKRSLEPPAVEKLKPQIRAILTRRETTRRSELLLNDLKQRWKPQIHDPALREFIKAGAPQEVDPKAVLADIGDDKITAGQILSQIDWHKLRQLKEPFASRALRTLLEENQIFGISIKKEALAQGYGQKPEIEKEAALLRNRLAVDLLLSRVAFAKLDVGDEEARAYWESHQDRFTEPEAVKVSVIVTSSESDARDIIGDLQSGADFAVTARQKSMDPVSAQSGGNLGWINKKQLQPELEKVAFSLQKGKFGIAPVKDRYLVVWVEDKKRPHLKPLTEVKEQARQLAMQEKSRETLKLWITKLRQAAVINIDDDAIRRATAEYEEKIRQKAEQNG